MEKVIGRSPDGSGFRPADGAASVSAVPASIPNAVPDGAWIEWAGGACPVPPDTRIDVRWDNRAISYDTAAGAYSSNPDLWAGPRSGGFIVAYRLTFKKPEPSFFTGSVGLPVKIASVGENGLLVLTSEQMPRLHMVGKSVDELLREAPIVIAAFVNLAQAGDAIATESRRAETPKSGSVHEGAGPQDIAQKEIP